MRIVSSRLKKPAVLVLVVHHIWRRPSRFPTKRVEVGEVLLHSTRLDSKSRAPRAKGQRLKNNAIRNEEQSLSLSPSFLYRPNWIYKSAAIGGAGHGRSGRRVCGFRGGHTRQLARRLFFSFFSQLSSSSSSSMARSKETMTDNNTRQQQQQQ